MFIQMSTERLWVMGFLWRTFWPHGLFLIWIFSP